MRVRYPRQPEEEGNYFYVNNLKTPDVVLGLLCLFGTIVGILGNGAAFCFFLPRRRRTIHDLLYMTITAVDFVTVSSSFPVIASLFNYRYPMFFANDTFCDTWISLVQFTARMSIFLAMIICINRTIIMAYPHRPINRTLVIAAVVVNAVIAMTVDVFSLSQPWCFAMYNHTRSSCVISINMDHSDSLFVVRLFLLISLVIGFLVPSLITTVCFVIGIRILMTRPALGNEDNIRYRRVSVTISIFTGVFLICNTPCILALIWEVLSAVDLVASHLEYRIFRYYMSLTLQIFPIFLNAVVNPLLYALRMRDFQNWIRQALKKIARLSNWRSPNN